MGFKNTRAVCHGVVSTIIISINLIQKEQLIFDAATDRIIFGAPTGAHKKWNRHKSPSML
jgi:hypothetical protein